MHFEIKKNIMHIIILGPAHPYRGGIAAFGERLAHEYQSCGHTVELCTFTLQYPSFLFPGKTQYSEDPAPKALNIVRKVNSCNPLNWLKVGREIKKRRPDLLITMYWLPFMAPCQGTIERIVRSNGHTHVVAMLHNMIPHEHRPGDRLFSRYLVGSSDGFVAMSKAVLEDLSLFDARKPRMFCPHPLYDHYGELMDKGEARRLLGLEEGERYVLFFGFIRAYKGLDLLLEAMGDERLKQMGVKLVVAGEFYGDPKPYMDQIARLDIQDRVVLKSDFIPDGEVNRYFRAADLIVQPYKSATQSGVAQIAFHFEKPMVVTNVGGLPEIVPDGKVGYVVAPAPAEIADGIVRYFGENREAEFTEGVRQEKKKYAWSKMTETLESVCNQMKTSRMKGEAS